MQKEIIIIGQLSKEEIEALKAKHGALYAVQATADNGSHVGYFRAPGRNDINVATMQIDRDTAMDFNYYVMKECFVGGSDFVIENEQAYISSQSVFKQIVESVKVELVKL